MSSYHPFRRSQTDYSTSTSSPLRQTSTASTNSSAYSNYSNPFVPSRTSTISSAASSGYSQGISGHKRGISEATGMAPSAIVGGYLNNNDHDSDQMTKNSRRSLRPLPQPPNASPLSQSKTSSYHHSRSQTVDDSSAYQYDGPPYSATTYFPEYEGMQSPLSSEASLYNRPHLHHASTNPHSSSLTAPDLEKLQNSSTGHLRTLSKFARSNESEEFSMTAPVPSVVGLQGRRQLKRTDSTRASKGGRVGLAAGSGYAWAERNWMDKQRQFLQAYEYLCHIGEAKEWIEDIIHKPIPPIVQLEEALRDGVTLAEVVQALYPGRPLRIFRNDRLQFRHSDNIALFFRFLEEVELPELFRFELIDLYEKKNIPKVIYCIHALSWLLYRRGIVDFRIGNLVGQLEFEHHELEQMQKGLDRAGINMPSFAGMGASFGVEPQPEPVETEEERIDRELKENESAIHDVQAQARGALVRLRLGDKMNRLWDGEKTLIELQSIIRGDWVRQIVEYRLSMRRFAVNLQSSVRGFLVRTRQRSSEQWWKGREADVLKLQSLIRARKARSDVSTLRSHARREESGIRYLQAAIRGALTRKQAHDQYEATRDAEKEVKYLQAAMRGMLERKQVQQDKAYLRQDSRNIATLQAAARGLVVRNKQARQEQALSAMGGLCRALQAVARGKVARDHVHDLRQELRMQAPSLIPLQGSIRAAQVRKDFQDTKNALRRHEAGALRLQSCARGLLLRQRQTNDRKDLQRQTAVITKLQALSHGALQRKSVGATLADLSSFTSDFVQLQSLSHAMLLRLHVGSTLSELEAEEDFVVELQAMARGNLVRSRFAEKRRFFRENMEKVIKVQSIVRAKIQGEAYKSLTNGKNPPVGTLKGFVHLLNDSDFDFDEEIEFERLRKTVVQHVRQNEMADQYITQLDIKIALLVKNKITLDEVVKHQKHFGGHVGSLLPNADMSSKDPFDLKALNKTSRRKLEHYQELFFILQAQSQYLARLFKRLREQATAEKDCERIKHLMMGLFGYAQKRREEYYLIKLMARSVKEEIDGCKSMQDYLRCNSFWNKLFSAYIKSPRDRKFMRDVLGPIVKDNVIDNVELDLESDPMQIYLSAINNEELRTGQRSRRRPDVPREEAIRDPETRETFIRHLQDLRDIADQFFLALEDLLHRMPFGVRFIAQQMFEHLLGRFQNEDQGHVLQVTGQWVWRCYLQPALTEPEKFGVVDRGLTQEQKRNLGEVAKVLGQISAGRLFGGDNVYLQPLNSYITESIQRLGDIWSKMISVQDAEAHFDIDEFNDLYAKTKPTLYIKMADIFCIHQLVAAEISSVCPNQGDMLRDIMRELGSVKSNESELMGVGSTEISLTLNPKLHNAEDPDAEIKALFMETKRCILYIIRVQSGASLMDIMVKPISIEDKDRWAMLVRDELSSNSRRRGAYSEANTLVDIGSMSYSELKRTALENILRLEHFGRLTRHNQYQDILNAIAVDIRTKHRRRIQRQKELEGVRMTLARLNDQAVYLEQQLKTYNDYIEQAMVTLQNKKGKKRFLMPFTKQWDHERELQRSGRVFKFGSFKYSARNLADKGVLVHWKGYLESQWHKIDLTISSNEVGVFTLDGSSGNMMIPGANAQIPLDDLLQAQFNNTQFMDFFEGALRVNVNLFLHLIMRKFYNE